MIPLIKPGSAVQTNETTSVDALRDIPGIRAEVSEATPELHEQHTSYNKALIFVDKTQKGFSDEEVMDRLAGGDPSIQVRSAGPAGGIAIMPVNPRDGEEELIAQRLKEILTE